jgi:hypothetical protein
MQRGPLAILLVIGVAAVMAVAGRALLPDRSLLPLDFLHEALLPWANDVQSPRFTDHYEVDAVQEYLPLYQFHADSLRRGELPAWNPFNRGGAAYLDNPVPIPFHPAKLLLRFLSPEQVYDLAAVVHFALAFLAMALYLRSLKLAAPAVLFGALCWTFSAFFVFNFVHERMIGGIGLLPLCLMLFERLYARPGARTAVAFGALLGIGVLISDPTAIVVYLAVFCARLGGYWAFEAAPPGLARLRWMCGAALLALAVSAPTVLSTAQGLANNVRAFDYQSEHAMTAGLVTAFAGYAGLGLGAIHPYALGSRASVDLLKLAGQTLTLIPFAGSFTLLFAMLAARRLWRDASLRWLILLLGAALALLLPPVAAVLSTRTVVLLTFVLVVGGAIGMHRFWTEPAPQLKRSGRLVAALAAAVWIAFVVREAALVIWGDVLVQVMRSELAARLPGHLLERYADWRIQGADRFFELQRMASIPNLLFLTGFAVLSVAWWHYARTANQAARAVVFLTAAAAPLAFALGNVNVVDTRLYPVPQKPRYLDLLASDPGPPRIAIPLQGPHDRLLMPALLPQLFGIAQVRGYGSLHALGPARLTRELPLGHPVFAVLGVNYLVTARDSPVLLQAYARVVYRGEINIHARESPASRFHVAHRFVQVASRLEALERARADERPLGERAFYITGPPREFSAQSGGTSGEVTVLRDAPTHVELATRSERGGLLVIGTTHYPGWRARVNGEPAEIHCVDGTIQGVWLPGGQNRVVLDYVHWPSRIGIGIQFAAFAVIGLAGIFAGRKRRTQRAPSPPD